MKTDTSAVNIDRDKGDFHYKVDYGYDAGVGLDERVVNYISDVKQDPDWVREFRLKALQTFESKPLPTHWATKDLEAIDFNKIRYYRAHAYHLRRRFRADLHGGLHRAEVQHCHLAQRGRRAHRAERREAPIHYRAKLVAERFQSRDQARTRARGIRDQMDRLQYRFAPDDEISRRGLERTQVPRRSALDRAGEQRTAPGHGRENDPRGRRNHIEHHLKIDLHRHRSRHLSRTGPRAEASQELQEQHRVRRASYQRDLAHRYLSRYHRPWHRQLCAT